MKFILTLFLLGIEDYMLPCFTKSIFGFDCPGCGLQRSAAFLIQGEFVEAFKMYPAIYPIILLFGVLAANKFFSFKYANQAIITLMILTVGTILINYILKFI
nr:DUF2752 domain-containing protein [Maribacter sp. Hal144]